ncbi:MAG: hypothetical protein KF779_16730 [Hyphomonadaceae bacterium]|nr:hypothetical protein [Hyphomonadaceae bacterium]
MDNTLKPRLAALRPAALLLLAGQILYVAFTLLHAGGNANDHHSIFAIYAEDDAWFAVHAGQFGAMAILLTGLIVLFLDLDAIHGAPTRLGLAGIATTVVAFALYGGLQAVDGVALKRAVNALADSAEAESASRFAGAEALRWLEWGMRSYHDFALGLALVASAVAVARALAWATAMLIASSGSAYLAQGWLVGVEGFSAEHSVAIVLSWILSVAWMSWMAIAAFRSHT